MPKPTASIAHIGIAVPDIEGASAFYRDVLGLETKPLDDADGASIQAISLGDSDIEFLQPETDTGPVAKFLQKRGPGIHHICVRVDDLDSTLARCREHGYRLVDEEPRVGAHGHRIAFVHPKSTSGILIELTE
ncbi:MAG: methylmalonyl-CoA epimerase [Gemmatimonadota bacterium]|nr:methylmalonyl-CoA epimerase [Gemmatimonadota bacterium]MDH5803939.1 methylmalonyl-CoA epimerase [Gemmatimonadota bacterium]